MKSVFDITIESGNYDGESFIVDRLDEEEQSEQNELLDSINSIQKKTQLPPGLLIVKYVCLFVVLFFVAAVIRSKISIQEIFKNAPGIFIAALVCAVVVLVLVLIERGKRKKVEISGELEKLSAQADQISAVQSRNMKLPENAESIEIFYCIYTDKKGKIKRINSYYNYTAQMIRCAVQNDELILFNFDGKFVIPKSQIKTLKKIKKTVTVDEWVQNKSYRDECFKKYRVYESNGVICHCGYLALILSNDFGQFFIRFPLYEEEKLQRLIGPIEVVPGKAKELPL